MHTHRHLKAAGLRRKSGTRERMIWRNWQRKPDRWGNTDHILNSILSRVTSEPWTWTQNCKIDGLQVGGQCPCKANVTGRVCDQCTEGSYNLQALDADGCTPCECNREGTINGSQACDQVTGDCFCKVNVRGTWDGFPEEALTKTYTVHKFICSQMYCAVSVVILSWMHC